MDDLDDFPTFDLSGKTALVTGASSGMGRRMALVLAQAGARVAVNGRRMEFLETLKSEIEAMGGEAFPLAFDIRKIEDIPKHLDICESELGPLDILINNAGAIASGPLESVNLRLWNKIFNTNVRAPFFLAREAGLRMLAREQGGSIINIASIRAYTTAKNSTIYAMSKSAMQMMTRALARELSDLNPNLNVNTICPGNFDTPMTEGWFSQGEGKEMMENSPRKRIGHVRDLDGLVLLLASNHSRFMTGGCYTVDDGQTLQAG